MLLSISSGVQNGRAIAQRRIVPNVGVGALTALVNGDVQTFSDAPCAPGLTLINGACFRAPGTQNTPYGAVAIPVPGSERNNREAAQLLGGGVTCATENVNVGPYAYKENVCRNPAGNIIANADLTAETAYVRQQLATGNRVPAPMPVTRTPNTPGNTVRMVPPSLIRGITNPLAALVAAVQNAAAAPPRSETPDAAVAASSGPRYCSPRFGWGRICVADVPRWGWWALAVGAGVLMLTKTHK